jgi:hypothetical protein
MVQALPATSPPENQDAPRIRLALCHAWSGNYFSLVACSSKTNCKRGRTLNQKRTRDDYSKFVGPYTLEIEFDERLLQEMDLQGVLEGELYRPLRDPTLFDSVRLERELEDQIWPNGADFDSEILRDWPERKTLFVRGEAKR